MELRQIKLVESPVYVRMLDARMWGASMANELEALEKYEVECASEIWLERCAAKIADRVASLENRLQGAAPEDRFELLDALRTFRQALRALEQELGHSQVKVERLAVLRAQARGLPRLRLVQSE